MAELVEVAVPFPIFSTFTYRVPEYWRDKVREGVRVVVPFRNRKLVGLALARDPEPPENTKLKEIIEVLDDEPVVLPKLIELGRWMAAYYFSPPGEAFRVMLPPGLLLKRAEDGPARRFWPVRKQLGVVELSSDPPDLTEKQAQAWELLSQVELPVLLSTLTRETEVSDAVLRTLAKKKALRIGDVEVKRSPWNDYGRLYRHQPVLRHRLNSEQAEVLQTIRELLEERRFQALLVHGVTGSGKTEIYLNAIEKVLREGRSALMLVPEIGLTPQAARAFRGWFGDQVAILHSALSEGERFDQWRRVQDGRSRVVLGTRSAIFAPVRDLGIVIIDEEHDGSYKQDDFPRYHARETAYKRCQLEDALLVVGSATPQMETYYQAEEGDKYRYCSLKKRVLDRPLPEVRIIDMRREFEKHGPGLVLSDLLDGAIRQRLERGEQALVLINRRGYTPVVLCRSCGNTEQCKNCSISLTYHQYYHRLMCHYCGFSRPVPEKCRKCGKEYIFYLGEGTEKIQEILQKRFPEAEVDRLDRDSVGRKGAYDRILGNFASGRTDILVGTQMVAKGHDFPQVTLVGVLAADQALRLADFRAAERTFQLLTQVAGRAGRGEQPGEVIIQTYYPNHYALRFARAQDYPAFYAHEVNFRSRFRYPPFSILANLLLQDRERDEVMKMAGLVAEKLKKFRDEISSPNRMRIMGPAPAALERLREEYRFQILLKTTSRMELHQVLRGAVEELQSERQVNLRKVTLDVDPLTLL
ncbi:MAG TPA: primosomal protein N' [Acidobacteriota bacterium]|nr:primosomal protein N' [Acidobacteriota bacterium]